VYLPNKIHEFQKYLTEWAYTMDPMILVVHEEIWKSFPEDVQKVISEAAQECGQYNKALARLALDNGDAEKWLKEHDLFPTLPQDVNPRKFVQDYGVEVTVLTQEERSAFRAKMGPVYEKWVDKIGKELVEAAEEDMKNAQY
jgi:TRAP-type C4-dicarboxylate transport system substrate-binding protein